VILHVQHFSAVTSYANRKKTGCILLVVTSKCRKLKEKSLKSLLF